MCGESAVSTLETQISPIQGFAGMIKWRDNEKGTFDSPPQKRRAEHIRPKVLLSKGARAFYRARLACI
jgi:hypothetical protein